MRIKIDEGDYPVVENWIMEMKVVGHLEKMIDGKVMFVVDSMVRK